MLTNYILIDYENVQPSNLELLEKHPFKIYVFVGGNQTKIPVDLVMAMQNLGSDAAYIRMSGNGPNALDFHIASYLGEFACKEPNAFFHVISRDKGFDPLITHLKTRSIKVQRFNDLFEIPVLRVRGSASQEEKIQAIVKKLLSMGQAKPRKAQTLQNTINTLFNEKLDSPELQALVGELNRLKHISVNEGNISYSLKIH